jgi:hypothetical protein
VVGPEVQDIARWLASTRWGRAVEARELDAAALARPMARCLWLRWCHPRLAPPVARYVVGFELGMEPRRVRQLEQRALRYLKSEPPTDPSDLALLAGAPHLRGAIRASRPARLPRRALEPAAR